MRIKLLLAILIAITLNSFAQVRGDFHMGYIVRDTSIMQGYIEFSTTKNNMKECRFFKYKNAEVEIFKPSEIMEYGSERAKKFFYSREININGVPEQVFLIKEKKKIGEYYSYIRKNHKYFFIEKDSILINISKEKMLRINAQYSYIDFIKSDTIRPLSFGFKTGISFSKIKIQSLSILKEDIVTIDDIDPQFEIYNFNKDLSLKNDQNFTIGAFIDIPFLFKKKISFCTGLKYTYLSSSYYGTYDNNPEPKMSISEFYGIEDNNPEPKMGISIYYNAINVPALLRYSYKLKKFSVYGDLGIDYSYRINLNKSFTLYDGWDMFYHSSEIEETDDFNFIDTHTIYTTFSLGLLYDLTNRYQVLFEVRKNLSNEPMLYVNQTELLIGFNFI